MMLKHLHVGVLGQPHVCGQSSLREGAISSLIVLGIINKHYESRLKISVLHDNKNKLSLNSM